MLDADNVESASKSTSKRRKVSRKKIVDSEPEDVSDREEDAVTDIAAQADDDDSDIEMRDNAVVEKAYLATKSMGDRDREVCFCIHLLL